MKVPSSLLFVFLTTFAAALNGAPETPELETVATFPSQQVTGVAVSANGRVFVNFPFWADDHTTSVAEVAGDGTLKPYPDEAWNRKDGPPGQRWVCVQSVYVDATNALWVLDPASPKLEAVVPGGPKLVKVDLAANKVVQTISFDQSIAPERSYLNDVRVDTDTGHAFITESGLGALIVVDLKSGQARRLLAEHPSTKVEEGVGIEVSGMKLIDPKTGKTPAFHADGIALDKEGGWLYFHALTGHTMYRIQTLHLRDPSLTPTELAAAVENLGETSKPDGMLAGRDGTVYLAAFERNAIVRFNARNGKESVVITDDRLQWPDSLCWGPKGKLYVTTSQIHRMPKFHDGVSKQRGPFAVYRLTLP